MYPSTEFIPVYSILYLLAPPCGGRLYGSSGLLESPKFEGRFPFTVSCTWILEVGPSSSISFMGTFKGLHTRDCQSSLLFRDGMNSTSPLIKNFCRSVRSLSFTSRGNVVYIEHKVAKHTESSFQFRWQEKTRNSFQGREVLLVLFSLASYSTCE